MFLTITLSAEDRDRFGVEDGLVLDIEALKDVEADRLQDLDGELGIPVAVFVPTLEAGPLEPAQVSRVAVWLALRLAGKDTTWADCTPRLLRAQIERTVDAGPPDGPSERSSEDATPPNS